MVVLPCLLPARRVRTGKLSGNGILVLFASTVMLTVQFSALSEVIGSPLPYDDILTLRDRMWEISPTLVRYDITEPTSAEVALAGLRTLAAKAAGVKLSGVVFQKPISNFYQTDPISRA